ncbi:general transcription factor II-I repeat domain-containing protein 2A-like [Styela clava]
MATKRRKVDAEGRGFNSTWTTKYFFVEHLGKPTCLICYASIAVNKECNIRRHYVTKHPKFSELDSQRRKDKIKQLKDSLEKQSSFFHKQHNETEQNIVASYEVAKLIAEHMKPFVDGEFVKECLMTVVGIVCPDKEKLFSNISLSARTVTRRIEEMSRDVKRRQRDIINNLQFFSIAIDESTDAADTAQLSVFVRGVSEAFDVVEEFVQLVPMKGTTTGADILSALLLCIGDMDLDLSKMVSITTDGAPAMTGKNRGVSALLQKHISDLGIDNDSVKIHCLIHQEALCAKALSLKGVMDTVVKAVNIVLSQGLNHRQFRQLLSDAENEYGDLLYFCDVRWLSRAPGEKSARTSDVETYTRIRKEVMPLGEPTGKSKLRSL